MKFKMWTRFLFVAFSLCACQVGQGQVRMSEFRVASYNIRLDTESDGDNSWRNRRESVVALMRFYEPDLFGMQEVLPNQLRQLQSDLVDYNFLGVGREDGAQQGEFSPIAYKRDQFAGSEHGTFWLSMTPGVPSIGWDAAFPRIVTWTRLTNLRSGTTLLVLNTHWDHVGVEARRQSARLVRGWIADHRRACEAVVLLGDFNAVSSDVSYRGLLDAGPGALADAYDVSQSPPFGPLGTFNGFDVERVDAEAIDHVLLSHEVEVLRYGVITQQNAGRFPSDHFPIIVDIKTPTCGSTSGRRRY